MSPHESALVGFEHGSVLEFATAISPTEDLIRHNGCPDDASEALRSIIEHAQVSEMLSSEIDALKETVHATMTSQIRTVEQLRDSSLEHVASREQFLDDLSEAFIDLATAQDRAALQFNSTQSLSVLQKNKIDEYAAAVHAIDEKIQNAQSNLSEQATIALPFSVRLGKLYLAAQKRVPVAGQFNADDNRTSEAQTAAPALTTSVEDLRAAMTPEEREEEVALLASKATVTEAVANFQITFSRLQNELRSAQATHDEASQKVAETTSYLEYLAQTIMPQLNERFGVLRQMFANAYEEFAHVRQSYNEHPVVEAMLVEDDTLQTLADRSAENTVPAEARWQKTYDQRAMAIRNRIALEHMSDDVRTTLRTLIEVDAQKAALSEFKETYIHANADPLISHLTETMDRFVALLFVRSQDAKDVQTKMLELAVQQHENDFNRTIATNDTHQAQTDLVAARATSTELVQLNTDLLLSIAEVKEAINRAKSEKSAIEFQAQTRFDAIETERLAKVHGDIPMTKEEKDTWIEHDLEQTNEDEMWFSERRAAYSKVEEWLLPAQTYERYSRLIRKIDSKENALQTLETQYQQRTAAITEYEQLIDQLGKDIEACAQDIQQYDAIDLQHANALEWAKAMLVPINNDYKNLKIEFKPYAPNSFESEPFAEQPEQPETQFTVEVKETDAEPVEEYATFRPQGERTAVKLNGDERKPKANDLERELEKIIANQTVSLRGLLTRRKRHTGGRLI